MVELAEGVVGVTPMPEPGWQVSTDIKRLEVPYDPQGRSIAKRVAGVTWTGGPLAGAHHHEFALSSW